ncbi:DNA polymerase III subunit psi [Legionella sp. km772]|uniref:DNA polymerase III subunit psi n=1 Tax=Legionella sp. km772 TaxID=2498111 RepID=UPI000F8D626D|nr:DNA polymerase III subunit psi [Legionella sp. km772]
MYTNLDLYYLNLMGIRPWLDKKSLQANSVPQDYKLLIFTSSNLASKEQSLLKQIIFFLALDDKQVKHLEVKDNSFTDSSLNAKWILAFGDSGPYKSTTILETNSLSEVINRPILKKKLFKCLVSLKSNLQSDE